MKTKSNGSKKRGFTMVTGLLATLIIIIWGVSANAADLPKSKMSFYASSTNGTFTPAKAFDNDISTSAYWSASDSVTDTGGSTDPSRKNSEYIIINLGSTNFSTPPKDSYSVSAIKYIPRSGTPVVNAITKYNIYISNTSTDGSYPGAAGVWTKVVDAATTSWTDANEKTFSLGGAYEAKYLILEVLTQTSNISSGAYFAAREITIVGTEPVVNDFPKNLMTVTATSEMTTTNVAIKAKDNDLTTYWRPLYKASPLYTDMTPTLTVDLGALKTVNAVRLTPYWNTGTSTVNYPLTNGQEMSLNLMKARLFQPNDAI